MNTAPNPVLDFLLTRDPKQRLRLTNTGLASALMLLAIVLMHVVSWLGLNGGQGLRLWTSISAAGLGTMFLAIRLGWSARLGDPSLTVPQLLYAVACCACAYRIAGAGQGIPLMMVGIVLMFGIFGLDRKQAWLIGAYCAGVFALAMFAGVKADPGVHLVPVQLAHFIGLLLFIGALLAVGARVATMRQRLRSHRTELADAFRRISVLASHDELTGLLNRRAMTHLLESERESSLGAGHQWSVAVLDVDHFKRVNDVRGHAAGDEALRTVARVCTSLVRKRDAVSRWGGEEFVILFRDADPGFAHAAAERVRVGLAATGIRFGDAAFTVTASVGVAAHQPGEAADRTLSRGDRALYEAKATGRNRVVSTP